MGVIYNSIYNTSNLKFWYRIHEYSPLIFVILTVCGLVTTYLFAVIVQEDVTPVIPRISQTGNFPPSSMVFTFTLGMAAILMNVVVFTLHLMGNKFATSLLLVAVSEMEGYENLDGDNAGKFIRRSEHYKTFCVRNTLCRIFGFAASVGVLGVGSFQVANSGVMHNLALIILGGSGFLFFILHSFQSKDYFYKRSNTGKILFAIRWFFIILGALAIIAMGVNTSFAFSNWDPSVNCSKVEREQWKVFNNCSAPHSNFKEDDGGFKFYVAANACQWTWLATFFILVGSIQMDLVRINYLTE